jgi:hypothetical protein
MKNLSRLLQAIVIACVFMAAASPAAAASVTLAWDANTEADLAGYIVHYGTSRGVYDRTMDVGKTTTWTFPDADSSKTYYFVVQAYNTSGDRSALSAEVSATAAAPAPSAPEPAPPAPAPAPSAPVPAPPAPAPTVSVPKMAVDLPATNSTVQRDFVVAGWAADLGMPDGPGVDAVHVWAYPEPGSNRPPVFAGSAKYGLMRADVGAAFNAPHVAPSGFALNVSGLAAGTYDLVIYARSVIAKEFNNAQIVRVTVQAPVSRPMMVVDTPSANSTKTGTFAMAGWALDFGASAGTGVSAVHVWAYPTNGQPPIFVGKAPVGLTRNDVGAAFGTQFSKAGYHLNGSLPAGTYQLVVFAYSSVARDFNNTIVVPINVK